ncbi:3-oxoacyl-ACP synthase [Arthrobacter sp. MYb211]|uniref:beta-ketoacyl-ACP synthase III n=1 Tax=unclassified Arthrobacter TaxID=235627 RepID=UPI000CFC1ED6|nr:MULTISPECIES: beta-ketoacyl-ACP synthase III [unclassified Arthrobacter]PRA12326.1 3-oxoacyl-ACP synthase [Arthrobacter sp. MYb221]PRC08789.1 3-oxoacyl-ACP synthase [Arthrobacter sp. MYb211]
MTGSKVVAFGHFQPERIVPNTELEKLVETSDEWITRRVGIQERRWGTGVETVDSMAIKAAKMALDNAEDIDATDIDLIIVATCTAEDRSPNMAARVAQALDMEQGPATMDVNAACSGFAHAVGLAQGSIAAGSSTKALVIGAEMLTDYTDFTDRTSCVLTADGAGAFIITASETAEISPVVWGSVPSLSDAVRIEAENDMKFAQNGQSVYRWTVTQLPKIASKIIERADMKPEELDAIVLHQANLRIIEPLAEKIGAPNARVATDVVYSGNTSAASVPLALSKLMASDDPLPSGSKALLFAFGGGLSYAGQIITIP